LIFYSASSNVPPLPLKPVGSSRATSAQSIRSTHQDHNGDNNDEYDDVHSQNVNYSSGSEDERTLDDNASNFSKSSKASTVNTHKNVSTTFVTIDLIRLYIYCF